MIKLIVGTKGTGKTKQLVEMINDSVGKVKGNIVCIEKKMQLGHNIDHKVRLINLDEYKVDNYEKFYGFFSGVLAGNYDIEQIYVDGILKVGNNDYEGLGKLLAVVDELTQDKKIVFTVSADESVLPESVTKYL